MKYNRFAVDDWKPVPVDFIWLLSPNVLRTLCRSQKAAIPWPEEPKVQLTPCGHVRWTWHFYWSKTIYWWHQHIVSRSMWLGLLLVFGKHEFDWDSTSCWSVRWLGISAQTSLAGQQIEDTSRRSFSESEQSGKTWLAGQQIENTSRRSFLESQQSGKTWLAGQQIENTSRRSFSESQQSEQTWLEQQWPGGGWRGIFSGP